MSTADLLKIPINFQPEVRRIVEFAEERLRIGYVLSPRQQYESMQIIFGGICRHLKQQTIDANVAATAGMATQENQANLTEDISSRLGATERILNGLQAKMIETRVVLGEALRIMPLSIDTANHQQKYPVTDANSKERKNRSDAGSKKRKTRLAPPTTSQSNLPKGLQPDATTLQQSRPFSSLTAESSSAPKASVAATLSHTSDLIGPSASVPKVESSGEAPSDAPSAIPLEEPSLSASAPNGSVSTLVNSTPALSPPHSSSNASGIRCPPSSLYQSCNASGSQFSQVSSSTNLSPASNTATQMTSTTSAPSNGSSSTWAFVNNPPSPFTRDADSGYGSEFWMQTRSSSKMECFVGS